VPDLPPLLAQNLDTLAVCAAIGALFAALVFAICRLGRRLERHRQWLLILEDRVSGRVERQSREVQIIPPYTPRPPPLSSAPTVHISEAMLETQLEKTRVQPAKPKDTQ
jgi:hypothetical protein